MNGDFLALLPKPQFPQPGPHTSAVEPLQATTVFAFHCSEGVIIAGDHRATAGNIVRLNVNWEACCNHFAQYGALEALTCADSGLDYNNCLFFGTMHGLIEDRLNTMGAALTRGKMENFLNYYEVIPNWAEIYAYWPNLMGDPAVDVWTAFPEPLAVQGTTTGSRS